MSDGWDESAEAWIADMGDEGDFGRQFVLDSPMLARVSAGRFADALDVGCGEGRFCRMLQSIGIGTIGIDPTEALLDAARARDPGGDYRLATAETMDIPPGSIDLVVSYLSLIDIPDIATAIARMVAAMRPGGTLLVANLTSFNTASPPTGWTTDAAGEKRFYIDDYMTERATWVGWRGIRIRNWHRPLGTYMSLFLLHGLILRHFAEPVPTTGDPARIAMYRRVPYFHIMEWQRPPA